MNNFLKALKIKSELSLPSILNKFPAGINQISQLILILKGFADSVNRKVANNISQYCKIKVLYPQEIQVVL
jgi:hypothetical protein